MIWLIIKISFAVFYFSTGAVIAFAACFFNEELDLVAHPLDRDYFLTILVSLFMWPLILAMKFFDVCGNYVKDHDLRGKVRKMVLSYLRKEKQND